MSELGTIAIEKRDIANRRSSKQLRKGGYVPASISCKGKESISVAVKADELRKSLTTYGRNALFNLTMSDDNSITGMVKEIHLSPLKGEMLHVDLQEVSFHEAIKADLSIRLKGLDILEFKKLMALPQMDVIRVKGLPQDIPDDITIDVSNVKGVENINISDVKFPEGIVPELSSEQCVISIVEVKRQDNNNSNEKIAEIATY